MGTYPASTRRSIPRTSTALSMPTCGGVKRSPPARIWRVWWRPSSGKERCVRKGVLVAAHRVGRCSHSHVTQQIYMYVCCKYRRTLSLAPPAWTTVVFSFQPYRDGRSFSTHVLNLLKAGLVPASIKPNEVTTELTRCTIFNAA